MRLAIIIVNYRTPKLVIDCLASLQGEIEVGCDSVVVVDNASGDNSVEQIEQAINQNEWSQWVQVLPSPVNGGFSAGNNLGLKAVIADAYLLLNSDTIVRAGAISSLLEAMQAHPEAGLISPRLEWSDGTPQISCFRYHSPVSELIDAAATGLITELLKHYDVPIPVSDIPIEPQWTSFACVLIRREVIEQIGLMDEGYFMYFDDVDYCRQARNAGWQILHWPAARVVHLRGGSGPVKAEMAARKRPRSYLYASRSRYFTKFYGLSGVWIANLFWLAGRSISLLRELVGNKKPHTCEYEAQDIWINWREPMKTPQLPEI
ncbi:MULTISPECIES: glycosyltransferase family 2 protein [unclassified Coleofasciculus]|uniref:glycosyltransferase family 2 protein n=1 Tax=unclassified Coleofasciculus TaxID=2692782 RepID=UPI00187ECD70|nr:MULTISPECIES: glycosyltransferase family 2 protein [unclassified Coleofasciculus]MBE9125772.1 glycosyltransferase family 2 protein [Coleofasciculus sp. LEGE 07081]MBE9148445.1 glycosyltransferase family 2 protein [Coleofasciculus sp. LEGE 07092]